MLTVILLLAVVAFVCAVIGAARPSVVPLWVAVVLLAVIELLRVLPLGR